MSTDVAIVIAYALLALVGALLVRHLAARREQAQADELKRLASSRGWTFEATVEKGFRVHRWHGATEAIPWVLEAVVARAGGRSSQRRRYTRWRTTSTRGPLATILCMGAREGQEKATARVATGDGWFASLARTAAGRMLDTALDGYFGDEAGTAVDATALRPVEGAGVPGFIVMALDPAEASRLLVDGLAAKLAEAARDRESALSDRARPWVLLRPEGINLGRADLAQTIGDVERFVRAGVAVARAARF